MPYSLDLIQKVRNFVENGGTITGGAHTFWIERASIYRCLSRLVAKILMLFREQGKGNRE